MENKEQRRAALLAGIFVLELLTVLIVLLTVATYTIIKLTTPRCTDYPKSFVGPIRACDTIAGKHNPNR